MDNIQANIRNFKDFLQLYNQMTETCFSKCVDNINSRKLDPNEIECIEDCSSKFIKFNHRLMGTFMEVQNIIVNQRMKDVEEQQAKLEMERSINPTESNNVQQLSVNT